MKPELEIEVLKRSTPPDGLDSDLRLTPPEWRLFMLADGRTSSADLARRIAWSGEAFTLVADKLKAAGLLAAADYTSTEYHELFGATPEPTPTTAPAPMPAAEPLPETGRKKFSASLKRRPSSTVPASAPNSPGAEAGIAPLTPANEVKTDSFHLRPLIDFIVSTAGGGTKGQLAVYRVFCKVPNELLLKSRITSLNLVGDDFEIQDANLKTRLLEATRAVLGVEYV